MKKILSLLTLLMFTVMGAWADVATLTLNGSEVSSPEGFFTHDKSGKFSFNTKFNGAEYDGISFTSGLKMESSTKILFTTTEVSTVTIVQSTYSDKGLQLDGAVLATSDAVAGTGCRIYTIENVAAGDHNIMRDGGESGVFYVKVEWTAAPVYKTVTFVNDQDWENVNVWAWNDTENFTGGTWPGVAMTDTGETEDGHKVYSWATTGAPKWILFNNGSAQTGDCDFVDGGKYNSTGRVIIKNDYTLKFKTEKEWAKVYVHAFNESEGTTWPGVEMVLDGDIYTATVQLENDPTYVVFNNGLEGDDLEKTENLAYEADKTYEFMKNVYTATFKTDAAWEHVYAYTWTGEDLGKVEQLGVWPGKELEAEAGVYNLTISTFGDAPAKIIFNGNSEGQTPNYAFTNGRAYKWITATPIYAMTEGQAAIPAGTVIDVKDAEDDVVATITYGVAGGKEFKTPIAYANEDNAGFAYYTEGNGDNGSADGGTLYIINPLYDGNISVGVCLNNDKAFYILEDGTAMEGYNGIKVAVKSYVTYEFPVKGGSTYKVYCTGSKLGFYGFDYTGYTKPVPTAEITKVELRGEFSSWGEGPVLTKQGEENVWVGTLDLTTTTSDQAFKLVVNGDQNPGIEWIGWNALTLDDSEGWISGVGGDGSDLKLANSTTGYQTYTVTATWVPNADASANWTLKIEGKDARVVPEDVYTLVGAFYNSDEAQPVFFGIAWDASVEANNMVKGSDGIYTKSYEDVDLEVGTIQLKVVKNNWEASYPAMNYEIHIADAGKYDVAFTFNPATEEVTAVATLKTFYTVAGSYYTGEGETVIFGSSWDPTDTNNDMELGTDGIYTLTLTEKELLPGTLNYKVVKNHNWTENWGMPDKEGGNAEYKINVAGKYDITIKFNPVATFTNGYHVDCEVTTTPTGIQNVKADNLKGAEVYNLAGQRMAQPAKGLYIVNGRKVVIK